MLLYLQSYDFISERRTVTQRASFCSHMGKHNNIIARELLVLAMWFIEQKVILFRCRTDIRYDPVRLEPVRPGPAMTLLTAYFSNMLKDTSLKL